MPEDIVERIQGAGSGKEAKYKISGYPETQSIEESFPELDRKGHIIGTVARSEAHSNPERIHAGVGIFIIDPDTKEIFLPKRSSGKDKDPSCLDFSTGEHLSISDTGHLETWQQAAIRGLEEEMGLKSSEYTLERIPGHTLDESDPTQTERRTFYIAKMSKDHTIILDPKEINPSGGGWFAVSDLLEFVDGSPSTTNKLIGYQLRPMLINDLKRLEIRKAFEKLLET